MICDKRTENHNFTITTNTSQHVEFFHSLIFDLFWLCVDFSKRWWGKNQDFMLISLVDASDLIGCGGDPQKI